MTVRPSVLGWILMAVVALTVGACATTPGPALSAIVDAPLIRPGSTWTYRVTDTAQPAPVNLTLTFAKEDVYKGAGVLAFGSGAETLFYDRDLNFIAVLRDGKVVREAAPSYRAFDFPFYVGKEWRAVFTFQDYVRTLSWVPVEVKWKVKEYDVVKVPAGEFRAFHLVSTPSTNWGLEEEIWYTPEVKQFVKRVGDRTSAHYLGKGKETWELTQYSLK